MDEQKSLAIVDGGGYYLAPATDLNTVLRAYQLKKDIISNVLKEGTDYGKIPGAGDKPALMKPGAEKFANIFGLAPRFEDVETIEDWTGEEHGGEPFFYYRQKCYLYRGEKMVGSADGSCNSWEKKYRYRNADRVCPDCGRNTLRKSKPPKTGYYCWTKIGGCGGNYADNDQRITGQEVGQVKNPDVAEQVNTILKMAQKRALVAAVLITTGASDYFTQDIEDLTYITEEPPLEGEWKPQPPAGTNGKQAAAPADELRQQPEDLKVNLIKVAQGLKSPNAQPGDCQPVVAVLESVLGGEAKRKELLHFLFGKTSLSKGKPEFIGDANVMALVRWLKPVYDREAHVFTCDLMAEREAKAAHNYALSLNGQGDLFEQATGA